MMHCQNLERRSEAALKSAALPVKYETKPTAVEKKKKLYLLDKRLMLSIFLFIGKSLSNS